MNTTDINLTAHQLIDSLPLSPMDSYVLLHELLDTCGRRGGLRKRARACIRRGVEVVRQEEKSVTFARACDSSLEARSHRRASTLREIRSVLRRMMRLCPDLRNKQVRTISTEDCRRWLDTCFASPLQWNKGRVILSGVLNHAMRQNWSRHNTAAMLPRKVHQERRIVPLSLQHAAQLLATARRLHGGACLPACALMLFAGLRPQETRRLTWEHINLNADIINISPQHSKTGGYRQVSIQPVLHALLVAHRPQPGAGSPIAGAAGGSSVPSGATPICPPGWERKWREVRRQSGILCGKPWVQDVLRHTYASYHLARFKDRRLLQEEMGHQSGVLLNRCYLNLQNITPATARKFWNLHQRFR